jgi:heme/copper-type cytochrome/quinol oxidase subunit 4
MAEVAEMWIKEQERSANTTMINTRAANKGKIKNHAAVFLVFVILTTISNEDIVGHTRR